MATKAIKAWGTTAEFDGTNVGEIIDVGRATRTRNIIRVFTTDSEDEAVEKISSGRDEGQLTLRCIFDGELAGQYKSLDTKFAAGTVGTLTITYKNGATKSMSAIILNLETAGGPAEGGVMEYSVTFDISGAITYTGVAA